MRSKRFTYPLWGFAWHGMDDQIPCTIFWLRLTWFKIRQRVVGWLIVHENIWMWQWRSPWSTICSQFLSFFFACHYQLVCWLHGFGLIESYHIIEYYIVYSLSNGWIPTTINVYPQFAPNFQFGCDINHTKVGVFGSFPTLLYPQRSLLCHPFVRARGRPCAATSMCGGCFPSLVLKERICRATKIESHPR